jgi:hydroxymethylbilane synthase
MPLAAFATMRDGYLQLQAAWGDPAGGGALVTARQVAQVADLDAAAALGEQVAAQLRAGGAR